MAQGAAALGGSATALELPSVDDEVDWADFPEVMRRVHDAQVQGYANCHPGWERRERATGAATDAPAKKKKRVEKPHTLLRAWIWHDDHPPAGEVTVHVRDSSLGAAASLFHVLGCGPRRTVLGRSAGGRVHLRVLSTFSMPRLTVRAAQARALARLLRREEGLEDALPLLGRHAAPGVLHAQHDRVVVPRRGHDDARRAAQIPRCPELLARASPKRSP